MKYNGVQVSCGYGWRGLYEPLIDLCNLKGIRVLQVKEKFGGLRFYVSGPSLDDIIDAAEGQSFHTCEKCGERGVTGHDDTGTPKWKATTSRTGWRKTLCESCRQKDNDDDPT